MFLFIDTCFWGHVVELANKNQLDLRPILFQYRVGTTEETWKEMRHFRLDPFVAKKDLYVAPVSRVDLQEALVRYPTLKEYDIADQTLIIAAVQEAGTLLTDDRDLLLEAQSRSIPAVRLPMFCLDLAKAGALTKTQVYQCLRFWEDTKYYEKKALKRWKQELQLIS